MEAATLAILMAVAVPVGFGALGFFGGRLHEKRRFSSGTLLVGIDAQRQDIELRVSSGKNNKIVWGTEKTGNIQTDGLVMPGEGASFTLNGSGRAFLVNRRTLRTMQVSTEKDEIETTPEDGWQVGMYAAGIHERNIARPSGGSWLDALAKYTPILVIAVVVILIAGFALISGKLHA